ncbi:hypothetical protein K3495_g3481 [Podosphaera aphanis]|nr:hypothetical protein K3495_g3481 [Podosphaera aphanis]
MAYVAAQIEYLEEFRWHYVALALSFNLRSLDGK